MTLWRWRRRPDVSQWLLENVQRYSGSLPFVSLSHTVIQSFPLAPLLSVFCGYDPPPTHSHDFEISLSSICLRICFSKTVLWAYILFYQRSSLLSKETKQRRAEGFFHSSHWWNVSSSSSIIQTVFIGELPVAPGEICILIYLSYILYISKFFIPLQWPHASFMRCSAVFSGPNTFTLQLHLTADEKFIVWCR